MKIPSFSVSGSDGKVYSEKDFMDGKYVIYFYPKDMTSGCTVQAQDFRDKKQELEDMGCSVFGVSKDSLKSHDKFCEKESLNFVLLSDEETLMNQAFGTWKEKSMYGRKYFGTERSTFVIENGEIMHEWRKVKAKGHIDEVLDFVKEQA